MSSIIKTDHEKVKVIKNIRTVRLNKNTIYDRCQFSTIDGTNLGCRECLDEKLPGGGRRTIRPDYDENGRLTREMEVIRDRYGNKSRKIMIMADGTINTDYTVVRKFKGKRKPLCEISYKSDGQPRSMVCYNYSDTNREVGREYYAYNDDKTIAYRKLRKDGEREILFDSSGEVISDEFTKRGFGRVNEKEFCGSLAEIFQNGLSAESLVDYLNDWKSKAGTC